jgi:predicted kinase
MTCICDAMVERRLIILTGPVGGGKSTVARALARQLRASGLQAAVLDLDLLYCMARQRDGFDDRPIWTTARRGAAALADSFYSSGMSVVIVEGSFLDSQHLRELREALASGVSETFITLQVSATGALRRAQGDPDPSRVISRQVAAQKVLYAEFETALPFLRSVSRMLAADEASPEELARSICESILADERGPGK